MKMRQGDAFIDHVAYGEGLYGPLHDPMFLKASTPAAADLAQWRRMATEIAKAGLPLHVHANLTGTLDAFLDQIEGVHRAHPIDGLRWTLAHVNQINASHLARMKRLNLQAAVHPWAIINGGINRSVFGPAPPTCRRCGPSRRVASCGGWAATAAARIRSCRSRRCGGR